MPRYNDTYFAEFELTPAEGEMLYRQLNWLLNTIHEDEPNRPALESFRDRVIAYTKQYPVRYGLEARE